MSEVYKEVYIKTNADLYDIDDNIEEVEIDAPDYVYLMIPSEWVCLYQKLLGAMADFGLQAIENCESACKGKPLYTIQCWNMFQSAIAAKALGRDKEANLFINYIKAQLDIIYKGSEVEDYSGEGAFPITRDGKLYSKVVCGAEGKKFYVDRETGVLYEKYLTDNQNYVYELNNDNNELEES